MASVWRVYWVPDWEDESSWSFATEAQAAATLAKLEARYPRDPTAPRHRPPHGGYYEEDILTEPLPDTDIEELAGRHRVGSGGTER